jgi:hypothetical protein
MNDDLRFGRSKYVTKAVAVANINLVQSEIAPGTHLGKIRTLDGWVVEGIEVIDDGKLSAARQQCFRGMRADKSCAARE